MLAERELAAFASLADFYRRVNPSPEEMEAIIRAGGFDEFGERRTRNFGKRNSFNRTSRSDHEFGI